ncbi:MAG: cellulase family glycosylhydrolase [Planctomycetia bacterium]|nr:cellulase family glycosylhydrolase [Planctomycetia bacterium]
MFPRFFIISTFGMLLTLIFNIPVFGEKPTIDCSSIRGVCYNRTPSEKARRELAFGKRVGLNAVRFWLSPNAYANNKDAYIQEIVEFVRVCDENGYKSMPILFNGNMLNPKTIEPEAYSTADAFATDIVNALKDEPGLLMWDIMNEPLCNDYIHKAPENERAIRQEKTWAFLRHEIELVRKLAPDNLITVGYTTAWEIEESTASLLDVLSFHDYSDTREKIRGNFEKAKEWSEKLGKQVMNTETGCLARANPYEMVLQFCQEYEMGWFLFELMIHGRCIDEHGIFYPDGTIRDAGTIAAMFGCFRNRGDSVVPTNPNREGKASQAIALIQNALTEYTSDAFDYRRSDKKKLLDACEVAANLLEACELVPMSDLPTAQIEKYRQDKNADLWEIRQFAFKLANRLKEVCQIL